MKCECNVIRCGNYFICQKCNRKILKKRKLNLSNNNFRKKNKCVDQYDDIEPEVIIVEQIVEPIISVEPEVIIVEQIVEPIISVESKIIKVEPVIKQKQKRKPRRITINPEASTSEPAIKPKPKSQAKRIKDVKEVKTTPPKLKRATPKSTIVAPVIIKTEPKVITNTPKFKRVQPKSIIVEQEIIVIEPEIIKVEPEIIKVEPEIVQPMKLKSLIQKNIKRCYECNKKIGLTGIQCRCQYYFCGLHRYPNEHKCTFDYVNMERKILTERNIKLIPMKFDKI